METVFERADGNVPLSAEEERIWGMLVERGMEISAPRRKKAEEQRLAHRALLESGRIGKNDPRAGKKLRERNGKVSDGVRRFIVMRASGVSFKDAAAGCGVCWSDIHDGMNRSDEVMAAVEAQEEGSRALMKAKAMSVVEQSQDEGIRPNFAQLQMAGRILAGLDREHFGEERGGCCGGNGVDGERKMVGGGGFVINVIGDAAAVCAKPVSGNGRALVYTDV